jgi:hypothetical protein
MIHQLSERSATLSLHATQDRFVISTSHRLPTFHVNVFIFLHNRLNISDLSSNISTGDGKIPDFLREKVVARRPSLGHVVPKEPSNTRRKGLFF